MDLHEKARAFDVTIIGAGLAGLSSAYFLARAGLKVLILERRKVGAGASGGLVGALAPHMPENWNAKKAYQLEAFKAAPAFWGDVERLSGMSTGFKQLGRLQRIENERGLEKSIWREEEAKTTWEGLGEWRVCRDHAHPFESAALGYVHDTLSAQINPATAVQALAAAVRAMGVEIIEDAHVRSLDFDRVIVAAGYESWPWLRKYFGAEFGEGTKGQAALLKTRTPWTFPMVTGDGFYIVPHSPHEVAVGSTSERYWQHLEIDAGLDALIAKVEALCPSLVGAERLREWAGVRPRAYRPDPLIGKVAEGVYVNSGGFKTGFSFAPKVAEDLADIFLGKPVDLPKGFTPDV